MHKRYNWQNGNLFYENMLSLKKAINTKVNDSVLITGSARSGTSIMGKLVHSLQTVEYSFEPPTVISLLASIEKIDQDIWKLLFETYLYEDFYVNAISGRNLNFNSNDDSFILNAKSKDLIDLRHSKSFRKSDINANLVNGKIAFKIPDIVPYVRPLIRLYPNINVVLMRRNPVDTLNSLLAKGWFSDESLSESNLIFPFEYFDDHCIPYWVKNEDRTDWMLMSEIDRCAYYYLLMDNVPNIENICVVDYDDLIQNPRKEMQYLCDNLNLSEGALTETILKSIAKSKVQRNNAILDLVSEELREKIIKNWPNYA